MNPKGWPFLVALLVVSAGALNAQSLNLVFTNSNANYNNDNIWVTFESSSATGLEGTANGTALDVIYSGTYQYEQSGSMVTSSQTQYWTQSMNLTQLMAGSGLNFTQATSVRAYVSLGTPLTFSGSGIDGGLLSFGAPTYTNTSDPNYNIRWDVFEMQVTPAPGDQGDITAINGIGIPMRMTSIKSGTTVQTTQTTTDFQALSTALQNYQTANAANNVSNLPTHVTNSGTFVRLVGINNGAQAGSGTSANGLGGTLYTSNGGATIGANATFDAYVDHVGSGTITTPLEFGTVATTSGTTYGFTGTASASTWNPAATYSATWNGVGGVTNTGTLTTLTTSGTGYAVQVSGNFTATGTATGSISHNIGSYTVIVPPDVNTGTAATSNFLQSATLYAGTALANYGLIYQYTSASGGGTQTFYNSADFVNAVNADSAGNGTALIQQVFHDLAAGYNFGLIGSNVIDPLSGMSFNDEGSAYWTDWETLKNGGTVTTIVSGSSISWNLSGTVPGTQNPGTMPFYADAQGSANGYYNQWAALIYNSSTSAYGNPYSDYLQEVDVNLLASPLQTSYNIDQVDITILPDTSPIPEPNVSALLFISLGLGLGGVAYRRRRLAQAAVGE